MPIMNSVLTGKQPSGTITISSNTTTNVADYEFAVTQVPTTAPAHYIEKTVDANGKLINSTNIINLNGVTDVGDSALAYAYNKVTFPQNTNIDLSSLTTISGNSACYYMFQNCTGITSVDLSSLTTISGESACQNMFQNCSGITSVDLSSLTTISVSYGCYYMFQNCSGITSVDLSSLTTCSSYGCQYMFQGCTNLTSVDLSSLKTVAPRGFRYAFVGAANLTTLSFPSLTTVASDSFQSMLNNVTGCTVHFPSNLSGTTGLDAATIGGTNTTVLFDLPASE